MRTITIPEQTLVESIKHYEHFIGIKVSVLVGYGTDNNGTFIFTVPQQYDVIDIVDTPEVVSPETGEVLLPAINDYTDLMSANPSWNPSKPKDVFSLDDLWHFIDIIRARRKINN